MDWKILLVVVVFLVAVERSSGQTGCLTDYYAFYHDQNSYGATQLSGTYTEDTCTTACASAASCYAVDFNHANSQCWIHTTDTTINGPYSFAGIDHYRRVCNGAPACAQTFWHLYHNTEVTGGALTSSGGTRAQCVTSCESLGTSCVGLTYVSTNCYVFLTSAPAVTVGNTAGAVHMRRCDAPVTAPAVSAHSCDQTYFIFYKGQLTHAGTQQTAITTEDLCISSCNVESPECFAADFNSADSSCWYHTTAPITANPTGTLSTVNQYRRVCNDLPACSTTTPHWNYYPSTKVGLGTANAATTKDACITNCQALSTCVALDFEGTTCTIFTTDAPAVVVGNNANSFHLRKCNAPVRAPTASANNCDQNYFVYYKGQLTYAGTQQTGITTVEACLAACNTEAPECYAADFNSADSSCWFHTSAPITVVPNGNIATVNQYRRVCNSLPACSTTTPHLNYYPNTKADSGTVNSAYTTLDTCITACSADATCVAVDFEGTSCYFFTTSVPDVTSGNNANSVHVRNCNAPAPSATLGCNEDFLVFYPGMQTAGGTLVGSTDTEYTCLERCTAAASCFGIDMVTVAIFVTCSLHTTAALTATPTAAATTNHYRRVCNDVPACDAADPYWQIYPQSAVGGGTAVTIATGVRSECRTACEGRTGCVAFDFDDDANVCTVFDNSVPAVSPGTVRLSYHFKRCNAAAATACTDQTYFALYRNFEQTGGTAQTGLTTWETCTAACTQAAPECFGVDFNTADNTCHHHTTSRLTTGPTAVAAGNVDHYRRVCGGIPLCTTAFWRVYPNSEVTGGLLVTNTGTLDDCIALCEQLIPCVAMNYASATKACQFFFTTAGAVTAGANTNSVHLRRCTV